MKSFNSDRPLHLYRLGTDQLEQMFGNIRTLTHSRNFYVVELIDRFKSASIIETVYIKNPHLQAKSRLNGVTTTDHSTKNDWTGDLYTDTADLYCCWNEGRLFYKNNL